MQTEITAQAVKVGSYAGASTSIVSALTLTEIGIYIGIATAVLTFLVNFIYAHRKDRRERLVTEASLAKMREEK